MQITHCFMSEFVQTTQEAENVYNSASIDAFLKYMRGAVEQHRMAEAEIREADDLTQDILHSLELENHDYHGYARLSKELRRVRQQRRMAKDVISVVTPVLEWMNANGQIIKDLERLLGIVRKNEKHCNNRVYTPKSNNVDLFNSMVSGDSPKASQGQVKPSDHKPNPASQNTNNTRASYKYPNKNGRKK